MAATTFQVSVGTSVVQVSTVAALATAKVASGVRVSLDPANTGKVYYGFDNTVTTATGYLLPAGGETTLNPAEYDHDLTKLYLIASLAGQTVTGVVL